MPRRDHSAWIERLRATLLVKVVVNVSKHCLKFSAKSPRADGCKSGDLSATPSQACWKLWVYAYKVTPTLAGRRFDLLICLILKLAGVFNANCNLSLRTVLFTDDHMLYTSEATVALRSLL